MSKSTEIDLKLQICVWIRTSQTWWPLWRITLGTAGVRLQMPEMLIGRALCNRGRLRSDRSHSLRMLLSLTWLLSMTLMPTISWPSSSSLSTLINRGPMIKTYSAVKVSRPSPIDCKLRVTTFLDIPTPLRRNLSMLCQQSLLLIRQISTHLRSINASN